MWKWIIITLSLIGLLGYLGYNFAISRASDMIIEEVANQVKNNEDEYNLLMNDPEVQKIIEEFEKSSIDKKLPFETKEEALKTVIREFTIVEINEIANSAQNGELNIEEIQDILQERFSEQEIEALKIIAIRELQKKTR